MTRWLYETPLLLASKSQARQALLLSLDILFETAAADLDERRIETDNASAPHDALALILARAKARAVLQKIPGRCVLAADQLLVMQEKRFHQCADRQQAIAQLQILAGNTHTLVSAVVFIDEKNQIHQWLEKADMTMRNLSALEIETYLDLEGPAVLNSVGCYHYESHGKNLFTDVKGSLPCILGMPVYDLEHHLVSKGYLGA